MTKVMGGPAQPVKVVTSGKRIGGPARRVYGYAAEPTDGRKALGGPALPVVVLTDADLKENGGSYVLDGLPYAMPVFTAPADATVMGGPAIPVYPVNAWPAVAALVQSLVSAEIGNVDADTIVLTGAIDWDAIGSDYASGWTVNVNGSGATISSATRQVDTKVLYIVLSAAVLYGDTVTIAYDSATGQIVGLATFAAQAVTNNVPLTVLLLDNFTGANGTNLTAHAPDIDLAGNGWTALYDAITLNGSGQAVNSGALWTSKYVVDVEETAVEIVARVNSGDVADGFHGAGVTARAAADGSSGLYLYLETGEDRIAVCQWSGGADQNASAPITGMDYAIDDNTWYWLKFFISGQSIMWFAGDGTPTNPASVTWQWLWTTDGYQYHDWSSRAFGFGATNPTATRFGIGSSYPNYTQPQWDYLSVTKPASIKRWLWLGDSLLSNYGTSAATARPYSRALASRVNGGRVENIILAFPGSGMVATDAYGRKMSDQITAAPALVFDKIIIGTGVNDGNFDANWDTASDSAIAAIQAKYPAAAIYWLGLWPTQNSNMDLVANPAIQTVCTNNGITYVDVSTSGINAGDYTDGVHLSAAGNDKATAFLLTAIP